MSGPRHADRPSHTDGSPLDPDALEVAPGTLHPYANIAALSFTGKDTAAGKSWEAWVRKYWKKKATGDGALSLEPESLE